MQLKPILRGFDKLNKVIKAESARQDKALETAVKVEGYRLMRLLKKEIQAGAPGGQKFSALSFLSRAWGGKGRLRPNKPLRRLALSVRYLVQKSPFSMHIGWVGPQVSKSWKRIAKAQQEGFVSDISESRRKSFRSYGMGMSKRSAARKYMFLRKETRMFKTPARPIMDPFWRARRRQAWANIRENYRKKMQGERI